MRYLLLVFGLLLGQLALATHNRAGEITYRSLGGLEYEITVTTYTKGSSNADRCEVTVYFGDGDSAIFYRNNGAPTSACPSGGGINLPNDVRLNTYVGRHTYPGPNSYWISMIDPNRNGGIMNIPNSLNVPFYIKSLVVVNPFLANGNSSPVLVNPPIDDACIGRCFVHNPGAVDPEGDSLSYELVPSLDDSGQPIPGYTFPPSSGGGTNTLDPVTGDYTWCSPASNAQGEWNIAILIKEYRKFGSQYILVGSILRDMQIDVLPCSNNPPVISPMNDTCVVAGSTVTLQVSATDPDNTTVTIAATGGPFQTNPVATFTTAPAVNPTGTFTWTPGCGQIRSQPFQVTFKAEDAQQPTPLIDYETVRITVIGPASQNVIATPQGTSILVDWDAPACSAGVTRYFVYRRQDCALWTPGPCETGVPSSSGYVQIGTAEFNDTDFIDNNNGAGLIHGIDYSYIIVAAYGDGSQGIASQQACAQLVRDVPIITHVTVDSTSTDRGEITVRWVKPLADTMNLDTLANPGPYRFELMRATGFSGTYSLVTSFSSDYFATLDDTMYVDTLLNTVANAYTYRIDFYFTNAGTSTMLGSTHTASSVYLSIAPSDNKLTLTWQEEVPWNNYRYYVFRETSPQVFILLDSTSTASYVDTGLVNGATYCYRVLAAGEYGDSTIVKPLLNYSQVRCEEPLDLTPPCAPTLTIASDCIIAENRLTWNNPNNSCADDVVQYNIYYTPVKGEPFSLLASIPGSMDTTYLYANPASIAGCYVVTALDTAMNESVYSTEVCVDNCPVYELPNVFTPDGDNINDRFIPFPYRYVESIDIKIFDRWGVLMFESTDPAIGWNGTNKDTKKLATAGVYYYVCIVNEIRVTGIEQRVIKGFIHLFPGNNNAN